MAPTNSLVKMQDDFLTKLTTRSDLKKDSMEKLAADLRERYRRLDIPARRAFIRQCLTMFANYENKWTGEVNLLSGEWADYMKGTHDVDFTVPLLTAVIDTMIVFYTKTRPTYLAKAFRSNQKADKLAKMCQEIGNDELARMLTYSMLQREALYLATATVSYRELNPEYLPHSPVITETYKEQITVPFVKMKCLAPGCSYTEDVFPETRLAGENPQPEEPTVQPGMPDETPTCPECLEPMEVGEVEEREEQVERERKVRLPRLEMTIPNPVQMQTDFNAATDKESKFAIKRKMIARSAAEYYYRIDLSAADSRQTSTEGKVQERKQREPLQYSAMGLPVDFTDDGAGNINEKVEEMTLWLEPCEYGLYLIGDERVADKYPHGCRLTMIGDKLVNHRPAIKNIELIRVQQGVRPMANTGMGMVHVADMNELINNCISLDYSVLRTHGFPIRIINGKYVKRLPQALQTIIVNNHPPGALDDVIHTESPSNTSGMLGVLTSKVEGYMSFVSGIADQSSNMQNKMQKVMGSATGSAGVQEMMADRMGLAVQMRVEADIDTIYSILWFYQQDRRNREILAERYDEATIDDFYNTDLRSMFYLEPVKGSDTPQSDSVNAFKMSSFAQLTASLTGMHQFDAPMFYDLVSKIGDSLNIPMDVGSGRKERNLAENRINRIVELYKDEEVSPGEEQEMVDPIQKGQLLAQAVMMKEKMMIAQLVETQMQSMAQGSPEIQSKVAAAVAANPELTPQDALKFVVEQMKSIMANKVEAYLYEWGALTESYRDWMQSNVGQASDLPVQLAVGILFSYSLEMGDQHQRFEMMKKMEMMGVDPANAQASSDSPDNPPGALTRGGSVGAGRPQNPHIVGEDA